MAGKDTRSSYETRLFEERLTEPDGDGFQLTHDAELRLARVCHEMGNEAGRVVLGQAKRSRSGRIVRETDIATALFRVVLDVLA